MVGNPQANPIETLNRGFAPDDREARIQQWQKHKGTPPFVSSPEWEEAQRRNSSTGSIWDALKSMIGPSSAHAEMIPQSPAAKALVERGLKAPGQQGEAIRALHALPEKVYVTDKPTILERLVGGAGNNTLGYFRPSMVGSGYQLFVNEPAHIGLGKDEIIDTLAHESGHGLAQITGVGGMYQPTGIGAVDQFANLAGGRISRAQNESLADALAGIDKKPNPQADRVKEALKSRLPDRALAMKKKK